MTRACIAPWRRFLPLLPALLFVACEGSPAPERETAPRPISWSVVRAADAEAPRTLTGVVRSRDRADLAFQVGGRVEEVAVEVGDRFEADEVLARLEDVRFRLEVDQARAALAEAGARREEARQDLERQQTLVERELAPRARLDAARTAFEAALAAVQTARARLGLAEDALDDTVLRSPYAGVVAARLVEPAQQVAPGRTVLRIQGSEAGFEVEVAVPETLIGAVETGAAHDVALPARPERTFRGRVTEIGPETGAARAYPVTLALLEPGPGVRAGMTAEVRIPLAEEALDGAVTIPASAFLPLGEDRRVAFVFDPGTETVARREIEVVDLFGSRALVASGLAPGEIVADRGLPFLEDGQRVTRLGVGPARYRD